MITDEERREIAEELRTRCDCNGFDQCDECQELSLRLFSDTQALCQLEGGCTTRWEELADLIDRPRCHNVANLDKEAFKCSRCGCRVLALGSMPEGVLIVTSEAFPVDWYSCPVCGAVVEDGN
nr:MAG TPA: Thaumarchaeal output domain 1 [Caudoviricetes sp.]DAH71590.1 MAG TPA: Thaumarchaeal output domain 1 [Caudoviricetes sp.]